MLFYLILYRINNQLKIKKRMKKCVIILDENLPVGLISNSSAVLAMTIGNRIDNIIGEDIIDASDIKHQGITNLVLPILKTNTSNLSEICNSAKCQDDIVVVDFCTIAQKSKNYEDYKKLLECANNDKLTYLGVALYGNKKKINSLCGSLPLVR